MSALQVHSAALELLLDQVRHYGAERVETGAFLLAPETDRDRLSVLALPREAGVRRRPDQLAISAAAISSLFEWAAEEGMSIRAQLHSHRRGAFLSQTDLDYGFNVEGFITSVIPRYAAPPSLPESWGWWEFTEGEWRRRQAPAVIEGEVATVEFDEEGAYGG